MKTLFTILSYILKVVAAFVFASGIILAIFGAYHFVTVFQQLRGEDVVVGLMAISLLRTIVFFLLAIVFFVFSLGVLVLFTNKPERDLPNNFPLWLRVKNFMQLKVILWEAILTTLVVLYLAVLVEKAVKGLQVGYVDLVVPGAILLLAGSIFLLKKGEH